MAAPTVLSAAERAVLDAAGSGAAADWWYRTRTRVDVGEWLRWPRLCVAGTGAQWLLFAPGKRTYLEKIPVGELRQSLYNSVTGELILAPATNVRIRRLKLPPVEGRELLTRLRQ